MVEETFTRRNLPHWYVPGAVHFVTFRLAGTLPRHAQDELQREKERLLGRKTAEHSTAMHRHLVQ